MSNIVINTEQSGNAEVEPLLEQKPSIIAETIPAEAAEAKETEAISTSAGTASGKHISVKHRTPGKDAPSATKHHAKDSSAKTPASKSSRDSLKIMHAKSISKDHLKPKTTELPKKESEDSIEKIDTFEDHTSVFNIEEVEIDFEEEPVKKVKMKNKSHIATTKSMWSEDVRLYSSVMGINSSPVLEMEEDYSSSMESDGDDYEFKPILSDKRTVSAKNRFLTDFTQLPSLSDIEISMTGESGELDPFLEYQEIEKPPDDVGKFVNPLTGEDFSESSESTEEMLVEEQEEEVAIVEAESSEIEFVLEQVDDKPIVKIEDDDINPMEELVRLGKSLQLDVPLIGTAEERVRALVAEITSEFISDLLKEVVSRAQKTDDFVYLKNSLDKNKLLISINKLIEEHEVEHERNKTLTRRVIDFNKRNGITRSTCLLDVETEHTEKEKYEMEMRRLDKTLQAEVNFKNEMSILIPQLTHELEQARAEAYAAERSLEHTINDAMYRVKTPELRAHVLDEIALLLKTQKHVSTRRKVLLQRQNTVARLQMALQELESISADLKIDTYISVQTQAFALAKKMEERSSELLRLYLHCNAALSTITHLKEKQQTLNAAINVAKENLNTLLEHNRISRESIFNAKLKHIQIRRDIKQVSNAGGILDKPLLLYDYDTTKMDVQNKLATVEKHRKELVLLVSRIGRFSRFPSIQSIHT